MKTSKAKVALIGRPNVGKSTLFNRLIRKRLAIVDPTAGVTRDWNEHEVELEETTITLIDTGGLTDDDLDDFTSLIQMQTQTAMEKSDLLVLILANGEVVPEDQQVASLLRKGHKPYFLVVNKVDGEEQEVYANAAYELEMGDFICVSAEHGYNISELKEKIEQSLAALPPDSQPTTDSDASTLANINIAIVGKPNAGKSSLLNYFLGYERALVSTIAGTTRDSILETIDYDGYTFRFVDTAGIRRKNKVTDNIEFYSIRRAINAVEQSEIVLHILDYQEDITEQDKKIVGIALNRLRLTIILVNKWDLAKGRSFREYADWLRFRFGEAEALVVLPISCLTEFGLTDLLPKIINLHKQYHQRIETSTLNSALEKWQKQYQFSSKKGILKLYYMTQIKSGPPMFKIFINNPKLVKENYRRYIINQLRKNFNLEGIPITISFQGRNRDGKTNKY
jgi:GTP-binding protein